MRARYTTLVFYALQDDRAPLERGTPSFVCSPDSLLALEYMDRADLAPYLTVLRAEQFLGSLASLIELASDDRHESKLLDEVYRWTHTTRATFVGYQREPADIAGQGTADIESEPLQSSATRIGS